MEWQPIETAPKDGRRVLIAYPCWNNAAAHGKGVGWAKWSNGAWRESLESDGGETRFWSPTHWMPLPEPPK